MLGDPQAVGLDIEHLSNGLVVEVLVWPPINRTILQMG